MATLTVNGQSKEIPDNSPLKEVCRDLDVPFGCENGVCGACTANIESGMENLAAKNEAESDFSLKDNERLMCQTSILQGEVKISC